MLSTDVEAIMRAADPSLSAPTLTALYLASLAALLFLSAGRLDWPEGWAFLLVYAAISAASLLLADPELVRERSRMRADGARADALLASISFLFLLPGALVVAGLDAGRFRWSSPIALAAQLAALAVFTAGNAFALWAMLSNPFFSTFVRIQRERGHVVVTSGPYRYMRHPGYAGALLAHLALPIALGSWWALVPASVGAAGFALRTALEDAKLIAELDGYGAYSERVRYRLFPGLW
jgi:protein-S-isoprenylcysteine O-methyltransferase Ste14